MRVESRKSHAYGRSPAASLALAAACAPIATTVRPGGESGRGTTDRVRISILGTTDVHGRIMPWDYYTGTEEDLGLARVATLVDSIRATGAATILRRLRRPAPGEPARVLLRGRRAGRDPPGDPRHEFLGYDAAAVGNHEFNYGIPVLERAVRRPRPRSAANVVVAGTDSAAFPAFLVVEQEGVRVKTGA